MVFNRTTGNRLTEDQLPQVDIYKYKQVIFVGDSRTEFMENVLTELENLRLIMWSLSARQERD